MGRLLDAIEELTALLQSISDDQLPSELSSDRFKVETETEAGA